MGTLLEKLNKPNDIKKIPKSEYGRLAKEIRRFLVNNVSKTGGHLASNLGAVELTIALHSVLDLPKDKIIWDVGHQSYTHKILTGRREQFSKLRKYSGLSGFPKRNESECDAFDTGHSSTSISAALGMAAADELDGKDSTIVAVIGDGALTGGMAYEALNNLSSLKRNFIIILNDNNMSISENVGGMSEYLNKIRIGEKYNDLKMDVENSLNKIPKVGNKLVKGVKRTKDSIKQFFVPGGLFDELGITYIGPVDGHDINLMIDILSDAKKLDHPVLIHLFTKKGYGYRFAMENPSKFHGIDPFNKYTGETLGSSPKESYTQVFSKKLVAMGQEDKDIVAITAAMPDGTGLSLFKENFPERFFDVGIAEEHAVTFAAGLAANGKKPFLSIYSSFYQRAYDQIIHDVCIQKLPVKLIFDRAGLVGRDGETHQGLFDISFLSSIPNMTVISPMDGEELKRALDFVQDFNAPVAVRFPRGEAYCYPGNTKDEFSYGKSRMLIKGKDVAIIAVGGMVEETVKAMELLKEKGITPTLVDARFLKPFDTEMIEELSLHHSAIYTIEEGIKHGGFGEGIVTYVSEKELDVKVHVIAIKDIFVKQGSVEHLRKKIGIDYRSIAEKIINNEKNG